MEILKKVFEFVMDILETVTFVGSIFIVMYLFVLQPNEVRGQSMDTTFHDGEYILTSKLSYKFGDPHRGDVVVFKSPEDKEVDFIKRIIGVPGDRVMVQDGGVVVNGKKLTEDYIQNPTTPIEGGFMQDGVEVVVPPDHLIVFGDNRPRSSDSRVFGPIPINDIIGKVFFRYFPTNRLGTIDNPYSH